MKNIIVLSILVILIGGFLSVNSANCQEQTRKYSFSAGNQFGFVYGQAFEIVYPVPNSTKGELLSELIWDMKPVFYYGMYMDFGRTDISGGPGFFSSLSFKAGVPGDTGIMENRDWRSWENDALTDFSSHTNKTREFYWLDIATGISFPVKTYFYVKPYLFASWMRFSFTGRDGYGEYARSKPSSSQTYHPINDNPMTYTFTGDVITYEQNWLLAAAGISFGRKFRNFFSCDLSFQISKLTYCAAVDEHIDRRIVFMDFTGWSLYIEPKASVSFTMQQLELSLEAAYRYIDKTRGETYIKRGEGNFYLSEGDAGAGLSLLDMGLLFKIKPHSGNYIDYRNIALKKERTWK